ncbi:uncharacterized protein GGS22DRAFT_200398 [Annulohypoxylon maeteangense]|uniref:uncharacterized protein n=1 Tax=Annulohypoxylon maeteangense TaxID=1927788 RepID=UPI0020089F0C|nr:uncharacterized protein GGS22DRAFT_200398 [Annulohypoxylon maeteangense]KAI0884703.1 hypothetical protein GGS22DRAFT_200398 [Annulohypoxylon maeteangense]
MSSTDMAELIRQMTAYDNSQEPRPAFNYPATVYGLVIPFMVVSSICVALRIYSRIKLHCLGWDDLLIVLFRISATIGSIFLCLALQDGFGDHILQIGLKFYICLATYTISTTLMKLCLLSQYLRIFQRGTRARLACWVGLAISALWGTSFAFCALFPCFPVRGFWEWQTQARCYGFGSKVSAEVAGTFAAHGGSNVVLDAMVLAVVVPLYFRRDTAWKQRLGIGLLLLLGVIVLLLSIWCLQTIIDHKAGTFPVLDPTWYGPKSIILAALEVDLASICASIPTFFPHLSQSLLGSIFVTQEVHITHQHRRLSGDSSYDTANSSSSGGVASGHYELQSAARDKQEESGGAIVVRVTAKPSLSNMGKEGHYRDDFVRNGVVPPNMMMSAGAYDKETGAGSSRVSSEGQRGFEREQERLRMARVESNTSILHGGGGGGNGGGNGNGKGEKTRPLRMGLTGS